MPDVNKIIVSRNGERKRVDLELRTPAPKYKDNPYAEPESAAARTVDGAIGLLKVSLFPGKIGIDFAHRLDSLFSDELKNADRLVIDLRGNPGGGVGNLRLMSYLTPDKKPIGYSLGRTAAEQGSDPSRLPRFNRIPDSKFVLPLLALKYGGKRSVVLETEGLGRKKFHGRTVVLVNEHTTGAAEMAAQFAKENGLAKIVGTKTPGRLLARSAFAVGSGYRITIPVAAYVTWQGNRIEGKGVEPDVSADWSYEAVLLGNDFQQQTAIDVVKRL